MNPIFIVLESVKKIMPHMLRRFYTLNRLSTMINVCLLRTNIKGKIILTYTCIYIFEAYHEAKSNKQGKGEVSPRLWSIKSSSGTYSGRTLSDKRILRSPRPPPGSLRNDKTSSDRQGICIRYLKSVWRQPCDLLSSRWIVRPFWPHRTAPTKIWTQESDQMYRRDYRIRHTTTFTSTRYTLERSNSRSIRRVRCLPPSSDYRKRTCRCKKNESDPEKHKDISFFKSGTTLIDQYEQLRGSMNSSDEELQTPGYGVFLLRGMLGWIKAVPTLAPTQEKIRSTIEVSRIPPENHNVVVNILANMVVSCMGGRIW